jgi:hypothetical protein
MPSEGATGPAEPWPSAGEIGFFMIAEQGILEAQALLLCKSIRRFAGAYQTSSITVVSPRPARRPSLNTIRAFERLGVDYLALDVDSCCPVYGTSFRVHTAALLERRLAQTCLVQLDSDTLFLGQPDFRLAGAAAGARPVDVKGMCTTGPGDPFDAYWRTLCDVCDVDYASLPVVHTTVDRQVVLASYNGGLVCAPRSNGVFQRTEDFFKRLVQADLRPHAGAGVQVKTGTGFVSVGASEYWGSSQAALSLAVVADGRGMHLLPESHNVPLHSFDVLGPPSVQPVHVHYHWLCSAGELAANPMLDGRLPLPAEMVAWLSEELPLKVA